MQYNTGKYPTVSHCAKQPFTQFKILISELSNEWFHKGREKLTPSPLVRKMSALDKPPPLL